ncbi:MAG: head GIN domain-containing protein [Bacteroidota bacterium]
MRRYSIWGLATLMSACLLLTNIAVSQTVRGNGEVVRQNRNIDGFEAVSVGGAFNVYISQGSDYKVTVEADENLLDHISTEVRGGVLYIKSRRNIRNAEKLNVYVRMGELSLISSSGASDVYAETELESENLELSSSGSSDIKLGVVKAESVRVKISGASDVRMSGSADEIQIQVSGSGDFKGYEFKTKRGKVSVSGAGDAYVHVTESLVASASGSGDVRCKGQPQKRNVNVSGAGDVSFM